MSRETLKDIKMKQAVQACFDNPTTAHDTHAKNNDVDPNKLKHEYRKEWYARNKGVKQ